MRFFLLSLHSAPSHSPSLCLISLCEEGENFKSPPETHAVSDLHESRPHVPTLWLFLPLYILPISLHTPETENTSKTLTAGYRSPAVLGELIDINIVHCAVPAV